MKQVLFLFLITLTASAGFSQTQLSINQAASKKVTAADKELNIVYQQVLKEYVKDAAFIKALKSSQKLWIQFRDTELAMMFPERGKNYYGSMLPSCKAEYLTSLINERVAKLRLWLAGKEEGDTCGSSIKNKKS